MQCMTLLCHWQQNLIWLNSDGLRCVADSWHCFGVSREAFLSCIICVDRTLGTPTYWCCSNTQQQTSCSAEFSQHYFQTLLKKCIYYHNIQRLTKFSPIGLAVCHYIVKDGFCSKEFIFKGVLQSALISQLLLNFNTRIFSNQGLKSILRLHLRWPSNPSKTNEDGREAELWSFIFCCSLSDLFALCRAKGILSLFEQINWK